MSDWTKSLRNYSSHTRDIDKELEEILQREEKFQKEGKGMYSEHFKDLNEIRKQFREACRKITSIGKPKPKDIFDANTSGSETDEELPLEDRVNPITFKETNKDFRTTYKLTRDQTKNIFESEEHKEKWFQEVIKSGKSDVNEVLNTLEYQESEDEEDKILKELQLEWEEMEKEEMSFAERVEASNLRQRIKECLRPENKGQHLRNTYVQSCGSDNGSVEKEKEKITKKKYNKTKKELYDSFCNKI